jgi:hypothetical protein
MLKKILKSQKFHQALISGNAGVVASYFIYMGEGKHVAIEKLFLTMGIMTIIAYIFVYITLKVQDKIKRKK